MHCCHVTMGQIGSSMPAKAPWCFDPVTALPSDLAAVCLSFVDVRSLLGVAQHVCHAWRDAIDGGLPAVWHVVRVEEKHVLCDGQLAEIVQKSRGRPLSLSMRCRSTALQHIRPLCNLRTLRIILPKSGSRSIPHMLSCFPVLEDLCVDNDIEVRFPRMLFLTSFECRHSHVKGLHNLPVLTALNLYRCFVEADNEWPDTLRKVTIHKVLSNTQVMDRIAALHQLTCLDTDWTFAQWDFFPQPFDKLSFLPRLASLQRFAIHDSILPSSVLFNHLGAITSLRELHLSGVAATHEHLQCVKQLPNLQYLGLCHLSHVSRQALEYVGVHPNITSLWLEDCGLIDYSPIRLCTRLRTLVLVNAHHLCSEEVQAITQLPHIEVLNLCVPGKEHDVLASCCTMRNLRELHYGDFAKPSYGSRVCAAAFASLPSLHLLESITIAHPVDSAKFVDCLVQMPRMRRVRVAEPLDSEPEARLRAALPLLEPILCSPYRSY